VNRRLVVAEVNLVLNAVGGIDDRLDCRVYDFPSVHVDFDFESGIAKKVWTTGLVAERVVFLLVLQVTGYVVNRDLGARMSRRGVTKA
jgi:hypothetical protein